MTTFFSRWKNFSFKKRLLLGNIFVVVLVLGLSMALIVPNCTTDCEARGELVGEGLARLLLSGNLAALVFHWWRKKR